MAKKKSKSWKTTASGWAILIGAIATAVGFLLDGNPETNPDYSGVVDALRAAGITLGGIASAVLGKLSRDDDVSSEDSGAK